MKFNESLSFGEFVFLCQFDLCMTITPSGDISYYRVLRRSMWNLCRVPVVLSKWSQVVDKDQEAIIEQSKVETDSKRNYFFQTICLPQEDTEEEMEFLRFMSHGTSKRKNTKSTCMISPKKMSKSLLKMTSFPKALRYPPEDPSKL